MRYWPLPSVTVVRTFSISAALSAWTVTSDSVPPEASRTVAGNCLRECAAGNARSQCEENRERPTSMRKHYRRLKQQV